MAFNKTNSRKHFVANKLYVQVIKNCAIQIVTKINQYPYKIKRKSHEN